MAIYDLIISNTSQPVVDHHRQPKKTHGGDPSTPRFLVQKTSQLHQPKTFFCQALQLNVWWQALPFAWVMGRHLLRVNMAPFPQACSRRTCQSISLTRARPLRCHSSSSYRIFNNHFNKKQWWLFAFGVFR